MGVSFRVYWYSTVPPSWPTLACDSNETGLAVFLSQIVNDLQPWQSIDLLLTDSERSLLF